MSNLFSERAEDVVRCAQVFKDVVIPNINWGASAIPAEGFAAWNEFEQALRWVDSHHFTREAGLMCDKLVARQVRDLIRDVLTGKVTAFENEMIAGEVMGVPVHIHIKDTGTGDVGDEEERIVYLTLRQNAVETSLVLGSARVSLLHLKLDCTAENS